LLLKIRVGTGGMKRRDNVCIAMQTFRDKREREKIKITQKHTLS